MDDHLAPAKEGLNDIRSLCSQLGLKYVDLEPTFVGVGIAVGFEQDQYVVLSIMGGRSANHLMITSGILNDIVRDRLAALDIANSLCRGNPSFPVFLHDADAGWSLMIQQMHPLPVVLAVPEFFESCVHAMPQVTIGHRRTIAERTGLGGRPWLWTEDDRSNLLFRSMM